MKEDKDNDHGGTSLTGGDAVSVSVPASAASHAAPKFTPGPWIVDLDRDFIQDGDQVSIEALTPEGMISREVCSLFLDTGENKDGEDYEEDAANARLIAAAPDLYTSLQFILEHSGDPVIENVARAALRKADGE